MTSAVPFAADHWVRTGTSARPDESCAKARRVASIASATDRAAFTSAPVRIRRLAIDPLVRCGVLAGPQLTGECGAGHIGDLWQWTSCQPPSRRANTRVSL